MDGLIDGQCFSYTDAIDASENDDFRTDFAIDLAIITKALPTDRRTNGPTDRRTNGPTDQRTDTPSYRVVAHDEKWDFLAVDDGIHHIG